VKSSSLVPIAFLVNKKNFLWKSSFFNSMVMFVLNKSGLNLTNRNDVRMCFNVLFHFFFSNKKRFQDPKGRQQGKNRVSLLLSNLYENS
jgi:hypothetical protein